MGVGTPGRHALETWPDLTARGERAQFCGHGSRSFWESHPSCHATGEGRRWERDGGWRVSEGKMVGGGEMEGERWRGRDGGGEMVGRDDGINFLEIKQFKVKCGKFRTLSYVG